MIPLNGNSSFRRAFVFLKIFTLAFTLGTSIFNSLINMSPFMITFRTCCFNELITIQKTMSAGVQGLEPQLTVPETVVLPLDDTPKYCDPLFIVLSSGHGVLLHSAVASVLPIPTN